MASWLASFFAPEFEGRALQKNGALTKDQLLQFFQHGKVLFENPDFKMALALGYQKGQNVQDLINQAQAKIWEDKVTPAVQGDFGINSLSTVLNKFQNDADFLRQFYEFVHLEEKALDEAEMPASEFEAKYRQVEAIKAAMQAQMEQHQEAMQGMSEEEKQRYMADMYKAMVDMGLGMSQAQACSRPGACSSHNHGPMMAPVLTPGVAVAPPPQADMPTVSAPQAGLPALPARQPLAGGAAMSETEQLAFFQSLDKGKAQ